MTRPTVYIIQTPWRWGRDGTPCPLYDLAPAERYGALHHLIPPGSTIREPALALPLIRNSLANFRAHDFLLLAGSPVLIAYAAMVAAERTQGTVQVLSWLGPKAPRYEVVDLSLSRTKECIPCQ